MLSMRIQNILKMTQKSLIRIQIWTIKNQNLEKQSRNPSNRTILKIRRKKFFLDISQKKFGSAYAQSPRKCSTSKFWQKSKETKRNFFRKFTKGIKGFDLGQKKIQKNISCLCTFKHCTLFKMCASL
jgi:hypothetical protein